MLPNLLIGILLKNINVRLEPLTPPLIRRCFALSYLRTACSFTPRLSRKSLICWVVLAPLIRLLYCKALLCAAPLTHRAPFRLHPATMREAAGYAARKIAANSGFREGLCPPLRRTARAQELPR